MKKLVLLVFVLVLSFGFVACGDDETMEGNGEIFVDQAWEMYPTEHTITSPVEIKYWSANSALDLHGAVFAQMVEEFNEYQKQTYPDSYITVQASFNGGYGVNNTKLQSSLIGGDNPEIAQVGVSSLALYYKNVIDQRKIFDYEYIKQMYEGLLQFAMYKQVFVGFPYFGSTNILVYNRTLAERTGMTPPTVQELLADPANCIWTWDYLAELQDKITKLDDLNDDVFGFASDGVPLYEILFTQGEAPYNPVATEVAFSDEAIAKGYQYMRDFVTKGYMQNPVLDPNHGTKIQSYFTQGKVGFLYNTSAVVKQMYDTVVNDPIKQGKEPLFEMDVLPFPKVTNYYSNQSGGAIVVFNNKPKAKTQAAIEFLRWISTAEKMSYYSTSTGYFPASRIATNTPVWAEYKKVNPTLDNMLSLMTISLPESLKLPQGRAKALGDSDFGNYSNGVFLDDCTRQISDVIKEVRDRVNYVLGENS